LLFQEIVGQAKRSLSDLSSRVERFIRQDATHPLGRQCIPAPWTQFPRQAAEHLVHENPADENCSVHKKPNAAPKYFALPQFPARFPHLADFRFPKSSTQRTSIVTV
jgi:hypothetical protein